MNYNDVLNLLRERIEIIKTKFGNMKPFENSNFSQESNEIFTFFTHEESTITLSYDKNTKALNFYTLLSDGEANVYHSQSELRFKHIQTFYGELLYVFEQMVNRYNIQEFVVYASPTESKLKKLYSTFSTNPNIISLLSTMGFQYYKTYNIEEEGGNFEIYHFIKQNQS